MTIADKRRAIWAKIEAEDEDSEWLWLCYYRLERATSETTQRSASGDAD